MTHFIVDGTSEPQDFQLKDDGEAFDGTGLDVELEITKNVADGDPVAVEDPPEAAWIEEASGTVRVTGCENLDVGQYLVRFKVTGSNEGFFPNGKLADIWRVVEVAGR